jgi:bifunctional non-homologous end joining protein LigD
MFGRSGEDITARYPEIADALRALVVEQCVLDGEIIAFDASGRPSFGRLQKRMLLTKPRDIAAAMARVPVRAVLFDCLALEGHDLRALPLLARKSCLARILPPAGVVQASEHIDEQGEPFYEAASEMGLEGIVGKRADSRYVGKRSADWVKLKCQKRQEFVIGGYTDPRGGGHFGALHVGVYEDGVLRHVTRVGGGGRGRTARRAVAAARAARAGGLPVLARRVRNRAITTGSSPASCARCGSPSGRPTAGCGIRSSLACVRIERRKRCGARTARTTRPASRARRATAARSRSAPSARPMPSRARCGCPI